MTAFTICPQLWQLVQAVGSFDSCYKPSTVLTAVECGRQHWQLIKAVDEHLNLNLTLHQCIHQYLKSILVSKGQIIQVASLYSCYMLLPYLTMTWSVLVGKGQIIQGRQWVTDMQGCINCAILLSGIGARGVSSEHMENMEMFSCSPT